MNIYTYYEEINFKNQKELIEIWKKSWAKNRFNPIVLSEADAQNSDFFVSFTEKIKIIHRNITGKELTRYGLSCYHRWLAYSTQQNIDNLLVCDYDIINNGFMPSDFKEENKKICFLDRYCPCFSYGSREQFANFTKDIILISEKFEEEIKYKYKTKNFIQYHDQEFLALNHEKLDYSFSKPRQYVDFFDYSRKESSSKLFHVAHRSAYQLINKFPNYAFSDIEKVRAKLADYILSFSAN